MRAPLQSHHLAEHTKTNHWITSFHGELDITGPDLCPPVAHRQRPRGLREIPPAGLLAPAEWTLFEATVEILQEQLLTRK